MAYDFNTSRVLPKTRCVRKFTKQSDGTIELDDDCSKLVTDLLLYAAHARVTHGDNKTVEYTTKYDPEANEVELQVPDEYLEFLKQVNVGDKLRSLFEWMAGVPGTSGFVKINGDYDIRVDDPYILLVDTSGGDVNVYLPPASTIPGKDIYIKKSTSDNNLVVINTLNGETIDGVDSRVMGGAYHSIMVVSDGSEWYGLNQPPSLATMSIQ